MAVPVVDLLEMIDVRHDKGNALPLAACAGKALFRQREEAAPVRQARQHVGQGQVPVLLDEPSVFLQRIADKLEVRPEGPQAGKFRRVALREFLDPPLDRLEPIHDVLQIRSHTAAVFEMDSQFPVRDGLRGPAQFVNLEAELTDLLSCTGISSTMRTVHPLSFTIREMISRSLGRGRFEYIVSLRELYLLGAPMAVTVHQESNMPW